MSGFDLEKIVCAYLGGWERMLSASRLANSLGVTREHASRKLMAWARRTYQLAEAEGSRKFTFIEDGLAAMPPGLQTPRELMTHLPGLTLACDNRLGPPSIVRLTDHLAAEGDPDIFQEVYAAMRRKEALLLSYNAKSGAIPLWFSPHALVDLPHRPHFRGHALWLRDRDSTFIDLVPSRIITVDDRSAKEFTGPAEDTAWNTKRDLTLALSGDLPDPIRSVMIQEWGYQIRNDKGRMVLHLKGIRAPLVQYLKDAMLWRTFQGKTYQVWQETD